MTGQRSQVKTIQDFLTLDLVTIVTPCTSCKHTQSVSSFSIQFWSKVKVFLSEPGEIKHIGKSDSAGHILEPQTPLRITPSHSEAHSAWHQHWPTWFKIWTYWHGPSWTSLKSKQYESRQTSYASASICKHDKYIRNQYISQEKRRETTQSSQSS